MLQPGDRPDEPQEQRIRPAPRPVRASPPGSLHLPPVDVPVPPGEPPAPEEGSVDRPDRTRMDPLILDRSTAKKVALAEGGGKLFRKRHSLSVKVKLWFLRGTTVLLVLGAAGVAYLAIRSRLKREASMVFGKSAGTRIVVPSSKDQVLDMLEAFLTASDVATKATYVLDRKRVLPLMEAAYASGRLPEEQLRFGVPQPLESGVSAVPAKVFGPPDFVLHLMVREEHGRPKLDWETYEQEISRRFLTFAANPGQEAGEFRLVLERAHDFGGVPGATAVRVAAPGSAALAAPVSVREDIAPTLKDALPWNRRRRALVRLEWETPAGAETPHLLLSEVVRWEFMP